ncbi:MAG TPA: calcium-translocating P-type ATPase, PMCA-type [Gemmataceae bacterium]|jgi:Ca2+-transporting ATPase
MRPLRDIVQLFPGAAETGLTSDQVALSRERFGANRLTPLPREPVWRKFLQKFDEPIIKVLLAASLLKIVVDLFAANPLAGGVGLLAAIAIVVAALFTRLRALLPALLFALAAILVVVSAAIGSLSFEGLAIMIAVALATGVAFLSEYRSDREFEKLNASKDAIRAKVQRDGSLRTIGLEDVVVGDLVFLEMGDEIPVDGRLVRANELHVDESLMTGESEPVRKNAAGELESLGGVLRGTQVIDGAGRMIATNVGDDTMLGTIARKLSGDVEETPNRGGVDSRVQEKLTISKAATPLQAKLAVLAKTISKIGYWAAIAIFAALLVRGLWAGEIRWPGPDDDPRAVHLANVKALLSYFVYMVIVIVVAVPEGLPMSVTVSLALAMRKMTRANALVRQLVATETIGSATVICSDKTGTLTRNQMAVVRLGIAGRVFDGPHGSLKGEVGSPLHWLIANAAVNSTANLDESHRGTIGNITEGALLLWLHGGAWLGGGPIDYAALRRANPIIEQMHFSSDRKEMRTVANVDGREVILVKGAPEMVLARCEWYLALDGSRRPLAEIRQAVEGQLRGTSEEAMRTLAFAFGESAEVLVYLGFAAISDPLRDDVPGAVAECRAAGIDVKLITGDNLATARAVARDAGLLNEPESLALTSDEFNAHSDEELKPKLPHLRILARARPLDKHRLVKLLQAENHVVAMTGDGTNDAPSLKQADVGLAMGIAGTEVAKEASQIVLLDDSFSTIVRAVHWGRSLYENIQRFVQFQLTINVSALAIAFLGPFLGLKPPFTVLQLLWINVIMDTFAAIALCSEPPRAGLMRSPPKRRDESILTRSMLSTILLTASFFVIAMLVLLIGMDRWQWFAGSGPRSPEFPELTLRQTAIFFSVYVFFQVWNQINCRSLSPRESGLRRLLANPAFIAIASLTVLGQWAIVQFGGAAFEVEPLAAADWLAIAAATASVLVFAEIARRLRAIG